MKLLQHCKKIAPFFFFPLLAGCFQYFYKTNTLNTVSLNTVQQLQAANKYFIIHFRDSAVALANIKTDKENIEGDMVEILPEHKRYLNPGKKEKKHYRVKANDRNNAFMEVHLYADQNIQRDQQHISIPSGLFNRMDVYELDKEATTANHVLSVVGVSLVTAAAITLITFAIACNCPQVYVKNDGDYQFVSGVYSGAVYSSLERDDYLPLNQLQVSDNRYCLKIKNVDEEEQFINRLQLLQVNHPQNIKVLFDRHGNLVTYGQLQQPISATTDHDVRHQLTATDENMFPFDSKSTADNNSSVELSFAKPAGAKKAKLVVHARNSYWSGYLYHSFAELFGTGYEKWRNEKDKSNPKEMEDWQKMQSLPMKVYIEKNGHWEPADYFQHTGNTASRDMIMQLDVSEIEGFVVKLKLATAYRFWDLDFAGMDFSENAATEKHVLTAYGNQNKVDAVDNQYSFLASGQEMNIEFEGIAPAAEKASYFLLATGYYHNTKKYAGKPQVETLLKFKNTGAFDRYSRLKFEELESTLAKLSAGRPQ